jgi:tetratricopeptide (TPR) repeat protein
MWDLFLERKNRVSTSFFLSCIRCAQSQLEKLKNNKSIHTTNELLSSLQGFIQSSYQELHKLHPQGSYQVQKIAFLATYDLQSAEFEARNELQENPIDQKLNILLADILYEKKEFNEAALYYQKLSFDVLPWEVAVELQKKTFLALQYASMQEELHAFVKEVKNSSLLPPYILKSLAQEAFKRSIFMDLPEALEEAKTYVIQALKNEKEDPELVMLLVSILQKENQIPKALSILDQYQVLSNPLFAFKRAVLFYTLFQKTGHSKYLEHADFEMFSIQTPETFPENLSSQVAESIIKPVTMDTTIVIPQNEKFFEQESRSSPGKILYLDPTRDLQLTTVCIHSSQGTGQLFCDSPYPYSLDKEWEIVKHCLHKDGIASMEQINTFDWRVSLAPSMPLPYEPASFRFQLSLLLLSHIHNIDLSNFIVATFYSNLEGVLEKSEKTSFLIHHLAQNPQYQEYRMIVPIGNLTDVVEEFLLHPAPFKQCFVTFSLKSFFQSLRLH